MSAVDEGFGQVNLAALAKILRERGEYPIEYTLALPLLKAVVARLGWRVAPWEVGPRCTRPQHPEDAVQHIARISPGSAATLRRALPLRLRDAVANRLPLQIRQVHP